mmetsp:Transcript_23781/g.34043  ORF Transcript_23781/g.34043 Transcript_23781/m.34043 type:complete len:701 (+) Transcript_23781:295-2397(+)
MNEIANKAADMFREITRVLTRGGMYICITLAEPFVLRHLLLHFIQHRQSEVIVLEISMHMISNQRPSPFIPFFITVRMGSTLKHINDSEAELRLHFDRFGSSISKYSIETVSTALKKVAHLQEFQQMKFRLGKIEVGRFETSQFWSVEGTSSSIPRFTVFVLDVALKAVRTCAVFMVPSGREADFQFSSQEGLQAIAEQAACRRLIAVCCNRPHSFPPMSELQGELSPIVLSLSPADMNTSDEKIPFLALQMQSGWTQIARGESAQSGPFIVEEQNVEDDEEDEDEGGDEGKQGRSVLRRLIFLQNQNFVQTEVRLISAAAARQMMSGSRKKKAKKNRKKKAKSSASSGSSAVETTKVATTETVSSIASPILPLEPRCFDCSYLDPHHRCLLAGLLLAPQTLLSLLSSSPTPTASSLLPSSPSSSSSYGNCSLLVGLGGGALPMVLRRYLPRLQQWVCDLDPSLLPLARKWFGFDLQRPQCHCLTAEGLALVGCLRREMLRVTQKATPPSEDMLTKQVSDLQLKETPEMLSACREIASQGGLKLLCIDADSKDPGLGMSAPPKAFTSDQALRDMLAVLCPGGVLFLNVVARSSASLADLLARLGAACREVGGKLLSARPSEETVNVGVLVLLPTLQETQKKEMEKETEKGKKNRKKAAVGSSAEALPPTPDPDELLQQWMQVVGSSGDPLQLGQLVGRYQ